MDTLSAAGTYHLNNSSSSRLESTLGRSGISSSEALKLKEACDDFEAIFIKQMLDSMKKTINRSELTKRNMGEELFEDMLYDEYAKKMSDTADLGIGDMMFKQLSRQLPSDIFS
ncbi:MAG: rod-binding protein [Spirochaetales bacterium]|nr:rod-binding protein [Spirochaetales bacterium]